MGKDNNKIAKASSKSKTNKKTHTPSKGRTKAAKRANAVEKSVKDGEAKQQAIADVVLEVVKENDLPPIEEPAAGSDPSPAPKPKPKANWSNYRAQVKQHFLTVGYEDKARRVALSRMKLWMKTANIDFYESSQDEAASIIGDYFVEGTAHLSYKQRAQWLARSVTRGFSDLATEVVTRGPSFFGIPVALPLVPVAFIAERLVNGEQRLPFTAADTYVDTCCEHVLDDHAEIHASASYSTSTNPRCEEKTYSMTFSTAPDIWVPRNCDHNMEVAATRRQLLPETSTTEIRELAWEQATVAFLEHNPLNYDAVETEASLLDSWLARYPKTVRPMMAKAWKEQVEDGKYIDPRTKAQVKVEVLPGKKRHKMHPRLVSAKTEEYHSSFGPEYVAFCKQNIKNLYHTVDEAVSQRFIYTGGMNAKTIGEIVAHFEYLGWYPLEGDYSRYDGRNEVEALVAEHTVYRHSGLSVKTCQLIEEQTFTKAVSNNGFKFRVKGKFASGVNNTSFGNTIRGWIIVAGFFQSIDYDDYVVMQLGDDNVIFTKDKEWDVESFVKYTESLGHVLEYVEHDNTKEGYDHLSYCSQLFWDVGTYEGQQRRVMGPRPFRCLGKSFMMRKRVKPEERAAHVKGVAEGYKHYGFVPVLDRVCNRLITKIGVKAKKITDENPHKVFLEESLPDIDQDAVNAQFEAVYGMAPADFDYLNDVPFEKMGRLWHLPGFDDGNVVDGMEGGIDNEFGLMSSMIFLTTGTWYTNDTIHDKADDVMLWIKRMNKRWVSRGYRLYRNTFKQPIAKVYSGDLDTYRNYYDEDIDLINSGFAEADW